MNFKLQIREYEELNTRNDNGFKKWIMFNITLQTDGGAIDHMLDIA